MSDPITITTGGEILRVGLGAVFGGMVTAISALPLFSSRLTKITAKVTEMEKSCTTCKSGVDTTLEVLTKSVSEHHSDADRHNSSISHMLLKDILDRVMRIEVRLTNGHKVL
jgi:uncharacterized protein Yka (UPF0111/DUF47 family)